MKKTKFLTLIVLFLIPTIGFTLLLEFSPEKKPTYLPPIAEIATDSTERDAFPALMVQDEKGTSSPVQLSKLSVDVVVIGNIATTTMEMLFYNDSSRLLEGELYFPLGEGQTVSRFAMDVEGKLREGVVVEKQKGQQVFENIIRQKIDPGLLEWTKGNNFKARVYPIPSKGYKRILIAYEQELDEINQAYLYSLPLNFKEEVNDFKLDVEVVNQEIKPEAEDHSLVNLKFKKWDESYKASYSEKNVVPNEKIGVLLPLPKNKQQICTEKVPGTQNDYYFYTTLTPKERKTQMDPPKTIGLVWDASGSSSGRDLEMEFELLESYFSSISGVTVKPIILRNDVQAEKNITVSKGSFSELKTYLEEIPFDGASSYRMVDYTQFNCDQFIVLGDGLSNFGLKDGKRAKKKVFTINSSASANHSYLKYLAASSGGAYINLLRKTKEEALSLLQKNQLQYTGNGQSNSYPSIPTAVTNSVHVTGIISGKSNVDFQFENGGSTQTISLEIDPEKHLTTTGIIRRIWAQKKLAELDINFEENEAEITALGMEYGIVTRTTSLIVLDRVEDYAEYGIEPPKELQEAYQKLVKAEEKAEADKKKEHLDKVRKDFEEYVNWYNTEIDLEEIKKEDERIERERIERDSLRTLNRLIEQTDELRSESLELSESRMVESISVTDAVDASYDMSVAPATGATNAEAPIAAKNKDGKRKERSSGKIKLEKWEPDAPYLKELKKLGKGERYKAYLKLKPEYGNTPSFFLDVSDLFLEDGKKDLALRVLSNIAELKLENHELMRVLAHRLEQLGYYDLAAMVFEEVVKIRGEEPQSYRDLGLCLAKKGDYQGAIDNLYQVVENPWDGRFPGIETIALTEINQIVSAHRSKVNTDKIPSEFIKDLPLDVRIILTWDSDNCDMDLWVTDPRKEKCYYSHKLTKIGGRMSNDFTRGYGPEMFTLKKAMNGTYKVQINYYGTSSQRVSGPTTIQMKLITNYGRSNQRVQEITRRLSTNKEVLDIGELLFE